ncbi:MAG: hypothetical protein ORN85_05495 [Sediminibacterium sp.]|nr:hypothetical protein [Sediminibacterium sp.]
MKTLSLKLEYEIFEEAGEITAITDLAINCFINELVNIYNLFNKIQLDKESKLISKKLLELMYEFEKRKDENLSI